MIPLLYSLGKLSNDYPSVGDVIESNNMTRLGQFLNRNGFFTFSFVRHPFERWEILSAKIFENPNVYNLLGHYNENSSTPLCLGQTICFSIRLDSA